MSSAQDPFYIVKEEIQDSIDNLQINFHQWEAIPLDSGEPLQLTKDLLATCDSIDWQIKRLLWRREILLWYGIDRSELDRRMRLTNSARSQVATVKKAVVSGKDPYNTSSTSGARRELMRLPNSQEQVVSSNQYNAYGNDGFITSESDRQMLLMNQQDEELDELSVSVERIGGVGLTIHEELLAQVKYQLSLLSGRNQFLTWYCY